MNCAACESNGKTAPATHVYVMATVPGELGRIPICDTHASADPKVATFAQFAGRILAKIDLSWIPAFVERWSDPNAEDMPPTGRPRAHRRRT